MMQSKGRTGRFDMREDIKKRIETIKDGYKPAGYKSTYGLSPISWKEYPLRKIASKVNRKNIDNKIKIVLSNTAMYGVIRQTDFFEKDIANSENIDCYYIVSEKDFVYNPRISSMASYGPINANELGIVGIVSPLYTVFRLKDSNNIIYDYVKHYFNSSQWHKYMYSIANYGARHDRINISDSDFFDLPVVLPPIKEQQRVVEILNHCDKVIELKLQLIEEERKRKKWMMQKVFILKRLPKKPLGELCNIIMGQSPDSKNYNNQGVGLPLIQGNADITNRLATPRNYTTEITKVCQKGDVLLSVRAPVGMVSRTDIDACIGRGMCTIRSEKYSEYIFQFLLFYEDNWSRVSQGSTFNAVSGDEIKKVMVPLANDIMKISDGFLFFDNKIKLLEQELTQWQQKKKALMQLLLTGIVRVSV